LKNYFFFLSSIWEGRAVGMSENLEGGWGQAVIEGLTMAQVLLLFLPKSGGEGGRLLPGFRRPWWESGELKKIGTKTVIGFLLVSRHIFIKVIRRHFLIGIFDRKLGGPICFGTFDVCLFVCFHPLDFFLYVENMF